MSDRGESDFIKELRAQSNTGEYHSTEAQSKSAKSSKPYTTELDSNQSRSLKTRPAVRRY